MLEAEDLKCLPDDQTRDQTILVMVPHDLPNKPLQVIMEDPNPNPKPKTQILGYPVPVPDPSLSRVHGIF